MNRAVPVLPFASFLRFVAACFHDTPDIQKDVDVVAARYRRGAVDRAQAVAELKRAVPDCCSLKEILQCALGEANATYDAEKIELDLELVDRVPDTSDRAAAVALVALQQETRIRRRVRKRTV